MTGSKSQAVATKETIAPEEEKWTYDFLAAYDVTAKKGATAKEAEKNVTGSVIKIAGDVEAYFGRLFERDEERYPIPIVFVGDQTKGDGNPVRGLIRELATGSLSQRKKASKSLAVNLAQVTPGQAKEGLLAVMIGRQGKRIRVVLWRFGAGPSLRLVKADSGEDGELELKVDPKTFTKQSQYFKAVIFEDIDSKTNYWNGFVRDTQVHARDSDHARYWVHDFLDAQSSITDARGTALLAKALKEAIREVKDPDIPKNLVQAAKLVATQKGVSMSMTKFADNLVDGAKEAFLKFAGPEEVREAVFKIDKTTAIKRIGAKRIYIKGDISVQAPVDTFEERVKVGAPDGNGESTITIRGKIVKHEVRSTE